VHGVNLPSNCLLRTPSVRSFTVSTAATCPRPDSVQPVAVLNYLITRRRMQTGPEQGLRPYTVLSDTVLSTGAVQHVDRKNYAPFLHGAHTFAIGIWSSRPMLDYGMRRPRTHRRLVNAIAESGPAAWRRHGLRVQPESCSSCHGDNSYGYVLPSLDLNLFISPS